MELKQVRKQLFFIILHNNNHIYIYIIKNIQDRIDRTRNTNRKNILY